MKKTLLALAAIAPRHEQAILADVEKTLGLGARREMPGDGSPTVAAHGGSSFMASADAKRHAFRDLASEVGMEQGIEPVPVAGGKRRVERPRQIGMSSSLHRPCSLT